MRETRNQPTITLSNRGGNKYLLISELRSILLFSMLFLTSLFILYSATKLHTFPHIRKFWGSGIVSSVSFLCMVGISFVCLFVY